MLHDMQTIQITDHHSNGFAEDEETVELAVYHGLNLLAGYSKYPLRGWGQEGLSRGFQDDLLEYSLAWWVLQACEQEDNCLIHPVWFITDTL